jgi:hypothetical protein
MFILSIAGLRVKTNTVHWVTSICLLLCGSYMFRHLRVILLYFFSMLPTWTILWFYYIIHPLYILDMTDFTLLFTCCIFWMWLILFYIMHVSYIPVVYFRGCLSFHVTHKDKDAPWGWHVGAGTCRSCIVINIYWRDPVHSVGFYTYA